MNLNRPLFLTIDKLYRERLADIDSRVLFNKDYLHTRPYLAVMIIVNNRLYAIPFSSPKSKRVNWKERPGYYPLDNNRLGALMINNMIPIADDKSIFTHIDIPSIMRLDKKYGGVLNKQYRFLDNEERMNEVSDNANNIYSRYSDKTLGTRLDKLVVCFDKLETELGLFLQEKNLPEDLAYGKQ
jgi:protein AbiQ